MSDAPNSQRRVSFKIILTLVAPFVGLVAAYVFVNHLWLGMSDADYKQYSKFWGGNPSEVFSHWLNMVLMSGGAVAIAWLTGATVFFRQSGNELSRGLRYACIFSFLILSGVIAIILDGAHGEEVTSISYLIFFIPILASTYYLSRQLSALLHLKPAGLIALNLGFVIIHVVAQLFYEPSETGGPNVWIVPLWLASVGGALLWALVRSISTGLFARFFGVIRKPIVWKSSLLVFLLISIPITLIARQTRQVHQKAAFAWLDDLEAKLTDEFVEQIRRDHIPTKADNNEKIPVSALAHTVLTDARIKGDKDVRIFVPVNQQDYIFLWGNDRFQYCDIRNLIRGQTEQIDQDFIDALIERGGTHQTRLFSILWSPYMAGRVLRDKAGAIKAICVINAP